MKGLGILEFITFVLFKRLNLPHRRDLVFFAIAPDRVSKLATGLIAAAGSVIVIAAVDQRDALSRGLPTPVAIHQGGEMEAVILVVCVGVALAHAGLAAGGGHEGI